MGMIADLFVKLGLRKEEYDKGLDDAQKKAGSFGTGVKGIFSQMSSALGLEGITQRFSEVTEGVGRFFSSLKTAVGGAKVFSSAMNIIKGALISTGIGALIVALGTLVSYFTMTERGAESLERGLAGLKAIFGVLIDRASMFGEGLVKIFSGDFSGGWDKMKGSVKGVGEEMSKEVAIAVKLQQRIQDLEDKERDLLVVQEERRKKAAELRLAAKEEGTDAEKKQAMLMEAAQIYKTIFADEKSIALEKASILKEQINLGEARDEKLKELAQLQASAVQKDTEQAQTLKALAREMKAVNAEVNENLRLQRESDSFASTPMKATGMTKTNKEFNTKINQETGLFETKQKGIMDIKTSDLGLQDFESTMSEADAMLALSLQRKIEAQTQFNQEFKALISSGLADAATTFAEGLGALMTGEMSFKDFGKTLLQIVGKFMVQFGQLIIGYAIAAAGLEAAIKVPGAWPVALAAGIALVAIGSAISSMSSKGLGSSAPSTGAASGYGSHTGSSNTSNLLQGSVVFELQGNKLQGVLNNQDRRNQNFR